MKNFKIEIKSNFHESTAKVIARPTGAPGGILARVPASSLVSARRRICGHDDCKCSLVLPAGWGWESDHSISQVAE